MAKARIELEKFVNVKGKIKFFGEKKPVSAENTDTVMAILKLMIKKDKRVIIITDHQKFTVKGIVVCSDICSCLGGGEKCEVDPSSATSGVYERLFERPISSIMTTSVVKVHDDVPLFVVVDLMRERKIGTLPMIDKHGDLVGVITERNIAFLLADTNVTIKIRDVMTPKVVTCPPTCTIIEALRLVCSKGFRRLPIVQDEKLVGYMTVKDLLKYFTLDKVINLFKTGKIETAFNEPVSTMMNSPVITIHPEDSITKCAQILKKNNIGALPVIEDDHLVGIITERDIVKSMAIPKAKSETVEAPNQIS
jgi:CBS domain-containing protein